MGFNVLSRYVLAMNMSFLTIILQATSFALRDFDSFRPKHVLGTTVRKDGVIGLDGHSVFVHYLAPVGVQTVSKELTLLLASMHTSKSQVIHVMRHVQ